MSALGPYIGPPVCPRSCPPLTNECPVPVLRFCVGQEKQMQLLKARVLLFEAFVTEAMASQTTQDFVWIIYARTR